MADQANIVGKVTADTSSAVASMNALKRSADATGAGFSGFAAKASKAIDDAAKGLGKFNLALGGIQKLIGLVGDAMHLAKFSAEMRNAENRMAGMRVSTEDLARAAGGSVDNLALMQFALKNLKGETALTKEQLELVLKAADNLSDSGRGGLKGTMEIAEDLAAALKGGPTRALRDYGIAIDEIGKGALQSGDMLRKLNEIAGEDVKVDRQLDQIERLEARRKNFWNDAKAEVGESFNWWVDSFTAVAGAADDAQRAIDGVDKALRAASVHQAQIDAGMGMVWLQNNMPGALAAMRAGLADANAAVGGAASGWMARNKKPKAATRGGGSAPRQERDSIGDLGDYFGKQFSADYETNPFFDQDTSAQDAADHISSSGKDSVERMNAALKGVDLSDIGKKIKAQQDLMESNAELEVTEYAKIEAIQNSTVAFQAMFQALADGKNPFSAFIKMGAQLLKAEAIKNSALALSALAAGAFGIDPQGYAHAAGFAKAAAANAAGAVLLGGIASASGISGGGGGGPSSAGASVGGGGGSIGSSGGDSPIVINVQGYVGNEKELGRVLSSALNEAQRTGRARARSNERWA